MRLSTPQSSLPRCGCTRCVLSCRPEPMPIEGMARSETVEALGGHATGGGGRANDAQLLRRWAQVHWRPTAGSRFQIHSSAHVNSSSSRVS